MPDVRPPGYLKDKRRMAANFDRAAADYDRLSGFQQAVCDHLAARLEYIRIAPAWIADLGSGTGGLSRRLRDRYPGSSTLEVDLSNGMLAAARPRWPWQRRRRHWICGDVEHLPLAEGSLDLAATNLMLQWCDDPSEALSEMYRTLKPGGLLLFSTLGPDTLTELRACWGTVDGAAHVNLFLDAPGLATALAAAGFAEMVLEVERLTLSYSDARAVMQDLKRLGTGNINAGRPRTLMGKGKLQQVMDSYEAYRVDGRIPATYEVIYGHAFRPESDRKKPAHEARIPVGSVKRRP